MFSSESVQAMLVPAPCRWSSSVEVFFSPDFLKWVCLRKSVGGAQHLPVAKLAGSLLGRGVSVSSRTAGGSLTRDAVALCHSPAAPQVPWEEGARTQGLRAKEQFEKDALTGDGSQFPRLGALCGSPV